jgi:hypothetical protein
MRQPDDNKTGEICAMDLAGPVPARPTAKELAAARAASYRERHGQAVTIYLPPDVLAAFASKCEATGQKKSAVIQRLIETQFLRKR